MSRLSLTLLAPLVVAALACNGEDDNPFEGSQPPVPTATELAAPNPPESSPPPPDSASSTAVAPTAVLPTSTPDSPDTGLPEVGLQRLFESLTFERMTGAYEDFEGNWYVTEQPGRIYRILAGTNEAAIWLDLTDRVDSSANEMGLLGFALAPDFEDSLEFYVDYTGGGQTVVARLVASPDQPTVDRELEERLLTVGQPFANHNGGQIAFGPDGYLYVALGDGGSGNDPSGNGQNLGTLLGSILRIDVSGGGPDYEVPADNPFVGTQGARGEIWAYGFRNPWRFSFDLETGDLWAGDVGQSTREEIDLVVRGGNYGWREMEGFDCRGGGSGCNPEAYLPPVFDYATGSGGTCSVTGGFVYRGVDIPDLRGAYVFSDYCSGVVYALRAADGVLTEQATIAQSGFRVSSLAQDSQGELYLLQHAGQGGIYKLVP